jgi:hypothetical protein
MRLDWLYYINVYPTCFPIEYASERDNRKYKFARGRYFTSHWLPGTYKDIAETLRRVPSNYLVLPIEDK